MDNNTINIYRAINEMKRLTAQGRTFSLVHATYSTATKRSEGIVHVRMAATRSALPSDAVRNVHPDAFLNYYDVQRQEPRRCYKCLLLRFNHQIITYQNDKEIRE